MSFYAAELVRLHCQRWSVCSNLVKPPLVCWSCDVRRFVGFPCGPFFWLALAVHRRCPHERSVRRHCGVSKVVVLQWEIVAAEGRPSFTVAGLAMTPECIVNITTGDQFQRVLSLSQLPSSSSVCCERCVCDGRVVLCDGVCALSLLSVTVVELSLCLISSQHEPACGVHGKSLTFAAFRDSFYSPSRTKVGLQIRWHECAFSSRCQHGRSVHHHCADVLHFFFLVSFDIVVVVADVAAREADADVKLSWLHDRSVHAQRQDPQ